MKLATETYEKFKANKQLYESRDRPRDSSIFISPSYLKMGQAGMGLSLGISSYSVPENKVPVAVPETVVVRHVKNELFVIQNPGLEVVFPLDMVRFDHTKLFNAEIDLNKLFEFVG